MSIDHGRSQLCVNSGGTGSASVVGSTMPISSPPSARRLIGLHRQRVIQAGTVRASGTLISAFRLICGLVAVTLGISGVVGTPARAEDDTKDDAKKASAKTFNDDVLPIFRTKCIRCHAGVEPKAELNLTQPSSFLVGGKSGAIIRIRAAETSLLYEKISSDQMPPEGQKLTDEEKGIIRQWINDGAAGVNRASAVDRSEDITDNDHWAFRPPVRPELPINELPMHEGVDSPIDAFIIRSLIKAGLSSAPEADRLTLIRRASFDLIGLPPTPDDMEAFLTDQRPDAFERMIDRLLASPRYGERWGRHWLDVAGYSDSAGILFEDRVLQRSYRYRDYVIRAFNKDKPYDRFLQEQFAGDELTDYWGAFEREATLPPEVVEGVTATGFLRTAADASRPDFTTIKNADALYFYPTVFDTLQIACSSTMGLTVQCARCHSHKFDPISQVDYYRMQAVFKAAYRTDQWIPQMNRMRPIASKKQLDVAAVRNAEVDANVKAFGEAITKVKSEFTGRLENEELAKLPEPIRVDVRTALDTSSDKRTPVQKYLVEKFASTLRPPVKELDKQLEQYPEYTEAVKENAAKVASEQGRRHVFDEIRALYDLPGEATTNVLLRGDPLTPGPEVEPGAIPALTTPQPFQWSPPGEGAKTSGRRLAFARWLTQPGHPLTARVIVNRIWMHHFGAGLVTTPEDFGVSGAPPSHPDLLDWLAVDFVENGWQIKRLHRQILTSRTWRQSSRVTTQQRTLAESIDPANRLLWRQNLRRLEGEPIRDASLAVSGWLSSSMYGFPSTVGRQSDGEVVIQRGPNLFRRSVYVQVRRLHPQTMLEAFDQPTVSVNCVQRSTSTVSTQALTLLHSDDMILAADNFSKRLLRDVPNANNATDDVVPQSMLNAIVERAVLLSFSRRATDDEVQLLSDFVVQQTKRHRDRPSEAADAAKVNTLQRSVADLCHMLLSSNEFVYID